MSLHKLLKSYCIFRHITNETRYVIIETIIIKLINIRVLTTTATTTSKAAIMIVKSKNRVFYYIYVLGCKV